MKYVQEDPIRRSCIVYWLLLWFTISEVQQASQGFKYTPFPLYSIPIQVIIVLFVSNLLPRSITGPIQVLQTFTALFLSIPTVVLTFTNSYNVEFKYRVLCLLYVLLNQILIGFFSANKSRGIISNRKFTLPLTHIAYLLIFVVFICVLLIIQSGIINVNLVSFDQLYSKRYELTNTLKNSELNYLNYALGWAGGILVPMIFYFGIKARYKAIVVFSICLILFGYIVTAQKWILASFFLVVLLHIISTLDDSKFINTNIVVRSFNYMICLILSLQAIINKFSWVDLGIRRPLLDPSIMLQYYVKFSSDNPPQWWSDSIFFRFFSDTDPIPVSKAIGERFFNQPEIHIFPVNVSANATAGSLADSIVQGGLLGMLAYSLATIGFFYLLQLLALRREFSIVFVLSGLVAAMLVEGTLHTLLLSRGLVIILLVFFLLPNVSNPHSQSEGVD